MQALSGLHALRELFPGVPRMALTATADVRSREEIAERLMLDQVARRTHNLVIVTAANRRITWVNQAFEQRSGYSAEEVIGRNCRFLQDDLPNDDARAEARTVLRHGGQGQIVFRNRRKDGEIFDNLLFLQGLAERRGGTRYVLGSQFLLDPEVTGPRIDAHLAEIDKSLARAVESQANLRAEQRRMFANAAHAVANAWLALRS